MGKFDEGVNSPDFVEASDGSFSLQAAAGLTLVERQQWPITRRNYSV